MLSFIVVEDFRMLIQPNYLLKLIRKDGNGSCSGRILNSTALTVRQFRSCETKLLLSA